MRLLIGGIVGLAVVMLAPAAVAAQRYAAPAGSGTTCTQKAPCLLEEAVAKAESGDEAIVGSGTHTVAKGVVVDPGVENVDIHGDFSGPVPKIEGSIGDALIAVAGRGSRISYLDVTNTADLSIAVGCALGTQVERVTATALGASVVGISQRGDCTVNDSVAKTVGGSSTALLAISGGGDVKASATNVTAIAEGAGSTGVASFNGGSGNSFGGHVLDLRNSIARGGAADLSPSSDPGGTDTIFASHSNFDTSSSAGEAKVIDGGGNQTAPPNFVDAVGGDYREASGSATIDAGSSDRLGTLDLAGSPRVLGAAADIGAYEFVPPAAAGGGGGGGSGTGGVLQALTVRPKAFQAANVGGALISAVKRQPRAPIGGTVGFTLSAPANVAFTVERLVPGRRAGRNCVKPTKANKDKAKCDMAKPVQGSFSEPGVAGLNTFRFAGRIAGKLLKAGRYDLVGRGGGAVKRAKFAIVG